MPVIGTAFGKRLSISLLRASIEQMRLRAIFRHPFRDRRRRPACRRVYNQAGLMVRIDGTRWVKAGIELSDGRAMLSSVLTDGRSDWATAPYEGDPKDFWMRASVADGVLRLQVSGDGKTWPLVRLAPFPVAESYLVGPMCCTPEREGLKVRFSDWKLTPPLNKPLHDLT